jgi:CRISPR/Cas system-associated protein Csm6
VVAIIVGSKSGVQLVEPTNDYPYHRLRREGQRFADADPKDLSTLLHNKQAWADFLSEAHKLGKVADEDIPVIEARTRREIARYILEKLR